ncbi:putative active regulator of SIRT1-like [Daphnia sinensis]|uniref:Active regulator of SIRT1 n=1 Tax=Daphnia sinensis TaxID=1820382 RepID=A0AAD5KN37_9CRUS|nr:putative active regulator of SIRT1-like [Daphnia sinensis]
MSTSLLKKSLRLFEDEEKREKSVKKKSSQRKTERVIQKSSTAIKKQATLKDRKVKSAIEVFVKKHPKQDKTLENLALLEKLSQKKTITEESANKIFSYQLKKQHKTIEKAPKKKENSTVFTEEDFLKFEREYFVKA